MKKLVIICIIFVIIFSSNLIINNTVILGKSKEKIQIIPVPLTPGEIKETSGNIVTQETLEKLKPKTQLEKPEYYLHLDSLSNWWNTDWEYRVNVTISEPNIIARDNWPIDVHITCLLYTSPSPRDLSTSRMPSSA